MSTSAPFSSRSFISWNKNKVIRKYQNFVMKIHVRTNNVDPEKKKLFNLVLHDLPLAFWLLLLQDVHTLRFLLGV